MVERKDIWPKKITVDKRIVSVLSQSTYDNFPRALKELVTNSYDADAKAVHITINLDKETVTILDTGRGMNEEDFEFYLRIAGKTRKKEDNTTPSGRKIIGQFGVGFLSIFPFFKNYKIESKKVSGSSVLFANIPLFKYFSNDNRLIDISSILIDGGKKEEPSEKKYPSYTKITLTGFNDLTKSFFFPKIEEEFDRNRVETYQGIDKLKWALSDDLPIEFRDEKFNSIFTETSPLSFEVTVNGGKLYREIYGHEILETHKEEWKEIGKIKFQYCIVTPRKSVKPYKARFLKIRNLNVGVGEEREHFGSAVGATRSRIHWLTGEIHILEGMNELIKVARDGFNYNTDYEELKSFFNARLNHFSNRLEKGSELVKEIKQTGREFRVSNVNLLKPEVLKQKIKKYEEEGFKIKPSETNSKRKVKISDEEKEINIPVGMSSFEKHIIVNRKRYNVTAETWNYDDGEIFPACRIEGKQIILNSSYPLFSGKKYTDLFVKLHLMLLIDYQEGVITKKVYSHFMNEILDYYSDYLKK